MKFFVDSADVGEIREAAELGTGRWGHHQSEPTGQGRSAIRRRSARDLRPGRWSG